MCVEVVYNKSKGFDTEGFSRALYTRIARCEINVIDNRNDGKVLGGIASGKGFGRTTGSSVLSPVEAFDNTTTMAY